MEAVDHLNQQLGAGSLQWAWAELNKPLQIQRRYSSSCDRLAITLVGRSYQW